MKLRQIARDLPALGGAEPDAGAMDGFRAAIGTTWNTSVAVAELWKALDEIMDPAVKAATVTPWTACWGWAWPKSLVMRVEVPSDVAALVEKRLQARADKDWAASDRLRDEIAALGWVVEDGKRGAKVHPKGDVDMPPSEMRGIPVSSELLRDFDISLFPGATTSLLLMFSTRRPRPNVGGPSGSTNHGARAIVRPSSFQIMMTRRKAVSSLAKKRDADHARAYSL